MAPNLKSENIKEQVLQAVVIDEPLNPQLFQNVKNNENILKNQGLFPVGNIPVLDYTLSLLGNIGVQETVVFSIGGATSQTEKYIRGSDWNEPGSMQVKVMSSDHCQSMGDVLRELDVANVIKGDFILLYSDTVSNANLQPILLKHRAIVQKDKGAVMTMIYSKANPGHPIRSRSKELVLTLDKRNSKIVSHQKINYNEKKISLPLELVLNNPCVEIHYDLLDPCVSICSMAVPPLFSDNFDFHTRDDFVRGLLLNEDIMGNTMYAHCLEEGEYAARVHDLASFHTVCLDIIHRWTYPFVPDGSFVQSYERYQYFPKNNVCKQPNVITRGSEIEDCIIGGGTKIGKGCKIISSVIGKNCVIDDGCALNHVFLMDNTVLEHNFHGEYFLAVEGSHLKESSKNVISIPQHEVTEDSAMLFTGFGSDTESSEEEFDAGAQHVDEYEAFYGEVLDSLVRGFTEQVELDGLVIEINASRFANNIPADEVSHWVMRAMLNVPSQTDRPLEAVLAFFRPIIERYVSTNSNDQLQCLSAIENEVLNGALKGSPKVGKLLMYLYDKNLVEEDTIISWYKTNASEVIQKQEQVQKFITWLQTAEEESDE